MKLIATVLKGAEHKKVLFIHFFQAFRTKTSCLNTWFVHRYFVTKWPVLGERCVWNNIPKVFRSFSFQFRTHQTCWTRASVFAVPPLSSFVITSRANEEKLPHLQHPVLLINPCCKQPRRCPSPLSAPPPPARSASVSLVHISAGVSGGVSSSLPMEFFFF